MFKDIFNNPEIIRNVRYRLRLMSVIITVSLTYFLALFVIFVVIVPSSHTPYPERFHGLFLFYAWITILIGCLYGVSATTPSIINEKDKKTYDFMFMTPLSDRTIAVGKLLGSTIHMWFLIALLTPFLLISGLLGKVDILALIFFYLILLVSTLLSATIGMLISVSVGKTTSGFAGVIAIIIIYFASASFIGLRKEAPHLEFFSLVNPSRILIDITGGKEPFKDIISFFGNDINAAYLTIGLYIWFIFWIMRAVIRRIRNLQGVLFTPIEAIIFFTVFEFLILGFQWKYMRTTEYFWPSFAIYLSVNIMLLLLLIPGITLSKENYFAYVRGRAESQRYKLMDRRRPAHLLFGLLCTIMVIGLLIITEATTLECTATPLVIWLQTWVVIAMILSIYLIVQMSKTILTNYGSFASLIIIILSLSLPPIVIGTFKIPEEYYMHLNPIAYLIGAPNLWASGIYLWIHPIVITAVLLLMILLFTLRHFQIWQVIQRRMKL
jgi:ABC-type transport system involved in multi-copper enzyme maturation permease subunit